MHEKVVSVAMREKRQPRWHRHRLARPTAMPRDGKCRGDRAVTGGKAKRRGRWGTHVGRPTQPHGSCPCASSAPPVIRSQRCRRVFTDGTPASPTAANAGDAQRPQLVSGRRTDGHTHGAAPPRRRPEAHHAGWAGEPWAAKGSRHAGHAQQGPAGRRRDHDCTMEVKSGVAGLGGGAGYKGTPGNVGTT